MSFWEHFIVGLAVTVLKAIFSNPKKYAGVKEYIDQVRAIVDEADDALGGGPATPGQPA